MNKVKMKLKAITVITGNDEIGVLVLVDEAESIQLAIVCDAMMKQQLALRMEHKDISNTFLPEVLWHTLLQQGGKNYEILISDVVDGQYRAVLCNNDTALSQPLRASDGVLLHLISGMPMYADATLLRRQAVPFVAGSPGMAMPLNALSEGLLREALDKAVEDENYEMASKVMEELRHRGLE